jgi:hypothetical protein
MTSLPDTRPIKPVIDDSSNGSRVGLCDAYWRRSGRTYENEAASTTLRPSSTAPMQGPKRGILCRTLSCRQGDKDHGACRQRWSSARS